MSRDDLIAGLLKRRAEIISEMAALDEKRRAIDALLAAEGVRPPLDTTIRPQGSMDYELQEVIPPPPVTVQVVHRNLAHRLRQTRMRHEIVEACREAIRRAGHPLPRQKMLQSVDFSRFEIASRDPKNYVSSTLYKSPERIVHLEGHGYWLAEQPYPPLDYTGDPSAKHPLISRRAPRVSGLGSLGESERK